MWVQHPSIHPSICPYIHPSISCCWPLPNQHYRGAGVYPNRLWARCNAPWIGHHSISEHSFHSHTHTPVKNIIVLCMYLDCGTKTQRDAGKLHDILESKQNFCCFEKPELTRNMLPSFKFWKRILAGAISDILVLCQLQCTSILSHAIYPVSKWLKR